MRELKLIFFVSCLFLIIGCSSSNNSVSYQKDNTSLQGQTYFLHNIDGKVVTNLEPSLLEAVYSKLLKENRQVDAANLLNSYDFSSGKIKNYMTTKDTSFNYFMYQAYKVLIYLGDGSWTTPLSASGEMAGETSLFRITAIRIYRDVPAGSEVEVPVLQYRVNNQNYGWSGWQTWGGTAGVTLGSVNGMNYLQAQSDTAGYDVWYQVMEDNIWSTWRLNGESAGSGQGNISAFKMQIFMQ